jgi:hypothetical protein
MASDENLNSSFYEKFRDNFQAFIVKFLSSTQIMHTE